MSKKLCKSSSNKVFAGVCGGVGDYLNIDPVIVRIIWLVSVFTYGVGVVAYIVAAIIMPECETSDIYDEDEKEDEKEDDPEDVERRNKLLGGALVAIGVLFIGRKFFYWIDTGFVFAAALIIVGAYLVFGKRGN